MRKSKKNNVQNFWNSNVSKIYGVKIKPGTREFYRESERVRYKVDHPYLKRLVNFKGFVGKKVLEIGIGMGLDSKQFAKNGADYTGIDLTPSAVENTKKLFKMEGLKGNIRVADAETLPYKDGTFDVVYSCGVLHHTPKTNKAIGEVYRVLKPGGQAIIMLYHKNSFHYIVEIILYRYILRLGFLKHSVSHVLNENTDGGGNPLSRVYSSSNIKKRVFKRFVRVKTAPRFLPLPCVLKRYWAREPPSGYQPRSAGICSYLPRNRCQGPIN